MESAFGPTIDWSIVSPDDMGRILVLSERLLNICKMWIAEKRLVENDKRRFIEPDPKNIAMDIAIYHVRIGVDIERWLNADNDAAIREFVLLQKGIDRVALQITYMVGFQFADSSKKPQGRVA